VSWSLHEVLARADTGFAQARTDPAMPARLRAMLVAYASLLLDRDGRVVELTPLGHEPYARPRRRPGEPPEPPGRGRGGSVALTDCG
jgi:hypothetical protein